MEMSSAVFFLLCASPYLLAREAEVFKGADSVALPCHYKGFLPEETPTVIWRRHDLDPQTVHLWPENDALHEQNQRFSGRTSMRPDALDSRDFSLNLRKIHLSDTGTYTCSIDDGREEFKLSEVKLWINGHQEEVKTKVGVESITLPCKITADVGDDVIVKWSRPQPEFVNIFEYQNGSRVFKEQDDIYCGRTSMSKDRVKSGDLSLTLSYPTERDSGVFLCTIYMKSSIVRQTVLLECIKETFPTWSKVLLILVILLLLAVSGGLLYFQSQVISVHSLEVDSGVDSVLLPCKTIFPLPKNVCIKWTNSSGRTLLKGYRKSGVWTTEKHGYFKGRIKMVENQKSNFSLTLKNPVETDTDTYTCTVCNDSERILATKQVQLKVKGGDNCAVIAIDIGFGYSGYAFNLKPRKEGGEAQFKQWDEELGLYCPKTPTCILFDENGNFLKFGYEAKTVYNKMGKEEAKKHYFFEEFKASLREKDWSSKIKDDNNQSMTIMKVVTEVLRFMKDDALETIKGHPEGRELRASDITWVVTIPGHWDYWTIYFLTDAAVQAGLVAADDTGKVKFINEPEAALAWCLKHPSDDLIAQNSPARPPGPTDADPPDQVAVHPGSEETIVLMETQTGDGNQRRNPATDTSDEKRYIVVNCGETIEFNVYEVLDGRATKKKYEVYNDTKGGRSVDMVFRTFLWMIFQELWEEYEENFPNEVQEMMINFLRVKHLDEEVWIRCPENLKEQVAKENDIERFFDSVEGASWDNGGIRITRKILRLLYEEIQVGLSAYINNILGKNFNIGSIVLVGGLAQSPILRQSITEEFGSDYKVLCPLRPQEVILKSAIELARNPKLVSFPKKAAGRFKCFS